VNPRVEVPLEMLLERFRVLRLLSERLEHCMMDALSRFVIVVDEMVGGCNHGSIETESAVNKNK
jgi:hypothetical protein